MCHTYSVQISRNLLLLWLLFLLFRKNKEKRRTIHICIIYTELHKHAGACSSPNYTIFAAFISDNKLWAFAISATGKLLLYFSDILVVLLLLLFLWLRIFQQPPFERNWETQKHTLWSICIQHICVSNTELEFKEMTAKLKQLQMEYLFLSLSTSLSIV